MIRLFILSWLVYWLLLALAPFYSAYPDTFLAFVVQFVFLVSVLLGYSWLPLASGRFVPMPSWSAVQQSEVVLWIKIALYLSVVGTCFLIYDKVAIQGIDYTAGLTSARQQWRLEGESRGGAISSIYSALGYLLSGGYFVAGILVLRCYSNVTLLFKFSVLACVFTLLMGNSILAGGRSGILLCAAFFLGAVCSVYGWSLSRFINRRLVRIALYLGCGISISYALFIFVDRADETGVDVSSYVEGFLPHLGLYPDAYLAEALAAGAVSDIIGVSVLALAYLLHSFSTTAAITAELGGEGLIVFFLPAEILYKLGLIDAPNADWFLSGRFPSLPGALLYQFGLVGLVASSLLIGWLSAFSKCLYVSRPQSLLRLGFFVAMNSILILSPFLLAVDFMSFPFAIFSFALVFFISRCYGALKIGAKWLIRGEF